MDMHDIFQKLTLGIKFDFKRFRHDAEIFGLIKKRKDDKKNDEEDEASSEKKAKLDDEQLNNGQLDNKDLDNEQMDNEQVDNEQLDNEQMDDEQLDNEKLDNEQLDDEQLDNDSKKPVEVLKRKHEDANENQANVLTLIDGISAAEDGTIIRPKKQKKVMTEEKILKLEQEKINQYRNKHHISVTGSHIPEPIQSFEQLSTSYNVGDDILQNMKNCGYDKPTPIQMQAIPIMLKEKQILACAPTGSGKTAAFLLPIIHHLNGPQKKGFRAIILNPTRELAKQTYRECARLSEGRGFKIHIINKINQALTKYGPKSSQKFDILITTPKRLLFLLNQEPPAIYLNNVEWLIIDEADKLFEEGIRGFKSQLEEISKACTNVNIRRGMFSATNTPAVTKWCRRNLKGLATVTIGNRNAAAELVEQELTFVGSERGKLVEIRNIIQKGFAPPALIFVQSKERAQELFKELIYDEINVDVIHSDRTQTQRDNVVRCFREGKIWVLICTELMSRGIDFVGVNLVINYDFPPSAISYIHRIGRTGRAGHKGKAITFFTQDDTTNLRSIANIMQASGCHVPEYIFTLKKHDKRERKKLERAAPKRASISTIPRFKKQIKQKGKLNNNTNNERTIGIQNKKKQNKLNNKNKLVRKNVNKTVKKKSEDNVNNNLNDTNVTSHNSG